MISQIVKVVEAEQDHLIVKAQQSGCQSCSSGSCGVTNFAHLLGKRTHFLKVADAGGYEVGELAELLLDERIFMRSVIAQYLLPLLSMFVFVLLMAPLSSNLLMQSIAALTGLLVGVFISRYILSWFERGVNDKHLQLRRITN